ncbi:ABC transporter permease subunit [Streptomyces sp. NPDC048496]|uniref:ABC transporter permease subunit n=1 Tax=Streptomyces sp. NPDC048496 TaxID=3365558 RepID=UPI00370F911E
MTPLGPGLLTSEWIKLRSVRSTYLTLLVAMAAATIVGILDYHSLAGSWDTMTAPERARIDPVRYGFSGGFYFAVLALGTLGVLATGSEYSSGLIRTTFTAAPHRGAVLTAKAVVTGALTLAVGELLAFTTYLLGRSALSGRHLAMGLADPGVFRAVASTGLFLCVMALLGLALGAILRSQAGAIATLFGLFFVLPMLASTLDNWSTTPGTWTLQSAFEALSGTVARPGPDSPSPGLAFAVCGVYLAVLGGLAVVLVKRRDA